MEKTCEFCASLRPLVYCQADAAYLCLSCDAKVHSANALSNRHLRTLLCDSCRYHPACARCLDHQMFICRICDSSLHGLSSQHQRRLFSSYVGCPSAKDFAALWGFELDELDQSVIQNQLPSTLCASVQPREGNFGSAEELGQQVKGSSVTSSVSSTLVYNVESEIGSSSQQFEVSFKGQQQQDTCFILQQILDLKKLQVTEVNNGSSVMHNQGQTDIMSPAFSPGKKLDDNLDHLRHSNNVGIDLQQMDYPLPELKVDPSTLPFAQPELLPFPSTITNPLIGEPFWQCKIPEPNSQLWSQNTQDLGVCEDIVCHDDFDIPDVDITFSNFEELFEGDVDVIGALLDDRDVSYSSVEKNLSLEKSDKSNGKGTESIKTEEDQTTMNKVYNIQGDLNPPQTMRPSYSSLSFTVSRHSAESTGTEYLDSGLSAFVTGDKASCHSPDLEGAHLQVRENAMLSYKEKKKTRSQVHRAPRRSRSDVRKQGKGRVGRTECYDSDSINLARSY